jgi:hypothetical protein
MEEDIKPWLRNFVSSVGSEKAAILLAGAGDFVALEMNAKQRRDSLLARSRALSMDTISTPQWLPDFKTGTCLAGSTAYSIPSTELLIEKIECCRRYFDSQTAQTCMNDLPSPSICKCLDCKEDEVCGGLWKGIGYPTRRSDSLHETKVHIVVSHCKESLEWMTEYTKDFIDSIDSIHIISKCGEPVEGAPGAATVEVLPNVGRW